VVKRKAGFHFETAMEELEAIVDEIEAGELELEAAMVQFEKGVKLTRECYKVLQEAEQQVKLLLEQHGDFVLTEFAIEDDAEEDDDE
jgi:exodeoxyribonuclease VII small subunit